MKKFRIPFFSGTRLLNQKGLGCNLLHHNYKADDEDCIKIMQSSSSVYNSG